MSQNSPASSLIEIPFRQFINGNWQNGSSSDSLAIHNPYTGDCLGAIQKADATDLDAAYRAAEVAQREWAARLPKERAEVFRNALRLLEKNRAGIVEWSIAEAGSTRIKAEAEYGTVHAQMVEIASLPYRMTGHIIPIDVPGKESRVYRKPVGVVGVISPWNWPLTLSHRSIGPALALGNGVVVKPADETPVTGGLLLAWIYEQAGLPAGLLNVVVGDVATIGDAFTLNAIPRVISFTGSTSVGRHIAGLAAQAPTLKHVSLELGGNAPLVVLDDADVDQAVSAAVFGRFLHQGQICMSTNRIIVDQSLIPVFREAFLDRVRALKCGDPADPATAIGPIISRRHLDRLMALIARALESGANPLLSGMPTGQVLPPHVFDAVDNSCELAQGETFGPVVPLLTAKNEEDALLQANATEYGLTSAVFSRDEGRALAFADRLDVGMTHINDITVSASANNPFGGEKNSGIGRFGGDWILQEFTTDHWITVQRGKRVYPF